MGSEPNWPEKPGNVVIQNAHDTKVPSPHSDTNKRTNSGNGQVTGDVGSITESIEMHLQELKLLNDEIDTIQELILKCVENYNAEDGRMWLLQAYKRLQQRVQKWVQQLSADYRRMRNQLGGISDPVSVVDASQMVLSERDNYKAFLIGSFVVYRKGIMEILKARPFIRIVGELADLDSFDLIDGNSGIDVIIAHIPAIDHRKIEQIKNIRKMHASTKVLLLVSPSDHKWMSQLVHTGSDAYLTDDSNDEHFLTAIDKVLKGETYISLAISESLLMNWKKEQLNPERRTLTTREKEVLELIAEGKSSKAIGEKLFISVHTVDRHRANLKAKLNMNKVTDLVKHAISTGLVGAGKRGIE